MAPPQGEAWAKQRLPPQVHTATSRARTDKAHMMTSLQKYMQHRVWPEYRGSTLALSWPEYQADQKISPSCWRRTFLEDAPGTTQNQNTLNGQPPRQDKSGGATKSPKRVDT
eukprot:855729-Amphidinium_carterae.1